MKLLRGRRTGWTQHLHNTASRVWCRLFESLGSLVKQHGTSMRKIFQIDFKIFQRRVRFPLAGWYTRETCHDGGMMEVSFVYHASRVEKQSFSSLAASKLYRNVFPCIISGFGSDLYHYRQYFYFHRKLTAIPLLSLIMFCENLEMKEHKYSNFLNMFSSL